MKAWRFHRKVLKDTVSVGALMTAIPQFTNKQHAEVFARALNALDVLEKEDKENKFWRSHWNN